MVPSIATSMVPSVVISSPSDTALDILMVDEAIEKDDDEDEDGLDSTDRQRS
jgi:hypothetical protein